MSEQGIVITITGDTQDALKKVNEFFKQFGEGMERISAFSDFFKEMAGKIAAVFTVGSFVEFTREAINLAEQLGKLSEKTGIAVGTLSAMKDQAHGLGMGLEELSTNLGLFSDKIFQAVRLGGTVGKVFHDIGVSLVDSNGNMRSTEAILGDVMDRFQKTIPVWEKAGVAMELFGRGGRDLIPILNEGSAGLEEMRSKGGGISDEDVARAKEFNRGMRELVLAFEQIFRQLASELLPLLKQFVEWLNKATAEGTRAQEIGHLLAETFKVLATGVLVIWEVGKLWVEDFVDGLGTVLQAVNLVDRSIKTTILALLDMAVTASQSGNVMAMALSGNVVGAGKAAIAMVRQVKADMADLGKAIGGGAQGTMGLLAGLGQRQAQRAAGTTQGIIGGVLSLFNAAGPVNSMFGGLGALFGGGAGGGDVQGKAPVSEAAKQLIEEVDKVWAAATKSKQEQLDIEEKLLKDKIGIEILDHTKAEEEKTKVTELFAARRMEIQRREDDEKAQLLMARVEGSKQFVNADPFQTENQKKQELLGLLQLQSDLEEQNLAVLRVRVAEQNQSDEMQLAALKQLQELEQKHAMTRQEINITASSGTFSGEFKRVTTDLANQWDSWAKQVADSFKKVFNTSIDSVANAITGLIMRTKTWGQAIREVGTSILTAIVNAISKMAVEWVANLALMLAKYVATKIAMLAVDKTVSAANKSDNAGSAAAGAIAGVGQAGAQGGWVGILIYLAVLAAAVGAVAGIMAGAFESGGRPDVGKVALVGEGGPELFVPDTAGTILPAGPTSDILSGAGRGTRAVGGQQPIHINYFDDKNAMTEHIRKNADARHAIVELVRTEHSRIGIRRA